MITNISTFNAYSYNTSMSGSKLYVPVSPAAVIYAQFDHVSGVAARGKQPGVSISKIQILNTLIEHLSKIKTTPQPDKTLEMSPEQADVLIKNYQAQIQTAVQIAKTEPYALAGVQPQTGALFSLEA